MMKIRQSILNTSLHGYVFLLSKLLNLKLPMHKIERISNMRIIYNWKN